MNIQNIQNNSLIESEDSYSIVLQALFSLKTIRSKFIDLELSKNNNTPLSNDFKSLYYGIFNSDKKFFNDFIKTYNDKAKNINDALLKDPYHFTKYLIQFLNEENIQGEDPNYLQTYEKEKEKVNKNTAKIISLFKEYYKNTQKSIIADNISFSEIILIKCDKCNNIVWDTSLNQILELDVEKFQKRKKAKYPDNNDLITLKRCFQYKFFKESAIVCPSCKDNNALKNKLILTNSKVLIIYLKRNEHKGVNDIKITEEIELIDYTNPMKKEEKFYSKYLLKCYISFKSGNESKYFVDYCVRRNGNNSTWYRFDKNYKQIQQNELFDSEPILLFYETTEKGKKSKNIQNSVQINVKQNVPNIDNSKPFINSICSPINCNMKINQLNQNNNINSMGGGGINSNYNNRGIMNNYYNNMGMNNMNSNIGMMNNNMGNMNMNNNLVFMNNNMGINNMNNNIAIMNNNMGYNYMNNNMLYNNMNNNMAMNHNNVMINQMKMNPYQNQFSPNNQFGLNSNSLNTQSSSPSNTIINPDLTNNNFIQNSDNNNNNITIICVLISEDNQEDELTKIHMQITKDCKIKDILSKYISKLEKNESVIKKFLFNDIELSKTSEQTAGEINLTNDSIIKGIKDASYDNNNNGNNNDNNVENNNTNNNHNNVINNSEANENNNPHIENDSGEEGDLEDL